MGNEFLNTSGFERAVARMSRRVADIASIDPEKVVAGLLADEHFKKRVIDAVSESDKLIKDIINDPRLRERIAQDILESHPTLIQEIINLLAGNSALHNLIVEKALNTPTFIDAVVNSIVSNETLIDDIKQQIIDNENLFSFIANALISDVVFLANIAKQIVQNPDVINHLTLAILSDNALIQSIANQIIETIASLSMVDPDGKAIAERDGGTFTFQAASNEQFGIVKGEQNNSPETWHLVNFINGIGHIHRQALVDFIEAKIKNSGSGGSSGGGITYQDIIRILGDIRLFGPDDLPIATNAGGHLALQQATPRQYGVCKPRKNSPCSPQQMTWRTMDDKMTAETKNDVHMFAPFSFPKSMPNRIDLFDKCTFIPIGIEHDCKPNGCHRLDSLLNNN